MRRIFVLSIFSLSLSACAAPAIVLERPALAALEPIEQPVWQVGTTVHQIDKMTGESMSWSIVEVGDGVVSAKKNDGCGWTVSASWFAPPLRWANCGTNADWKSGIRTITEAKGELWPLRVGNRAIYKADLESESGQRSSEERICTVEGPVRIGTGMDEVDTVKVVCTSVYDGSNRSVAIWYWTADRGEVVYTRKSDKHGLERHDETIKVEYPGTT